jgi:hypothetical protein
MVEGKSEREVARYFGIHRKTVKKMCQYAIPPGYQRKKEPISPKLAGYTSIIDTILEADKQAHVRGQLKTTKTKSGKREVTLQPQAKEALLNQKTFTEKQNETVFHNPQTNQPWKNDQPIRKNVWIPALKEPI